VAAGNGLPATGSGGVALQTAFFCQQLWPHVELALAWIDHHGDIDGDGFVEYARQSRDGLASQGGRAPSMRSCMPTAAWLRHRWR
jgi:hypothetical protein